jgi:Zn-dependent protease with chaperone function
MVRKLLSLYLSLIVLYCHGQASFSTSYSPARNFRPSSITVKAISAAYGEEIKNNTAENKKMREMINKSLAELSKDVVMLDSLHLLMDSDSITHYLKNIVDHISEKNPGFVKQQKFYVFLSRTNVPNAFNYGKGVVLVNLGMINKLHSEPEVAFVLCHEMAHQVLDHVMKGIKKEAEIYCNKDFQKELKKAQHMEYNSLNATSALRVKYLSRFTMHSREQEYEADSLGLILFYNAGYSPSAAVSQTNFLDSIDIPLYTAPINYRNYFEFSQVPFKNEWLNLDPNLGELGGNLDSLFLPPDSLKTHPDCLLRAKALERISKRENMNPANNFLLSTDFYYYQTASLFERVEFYLDAKAYGLALYNALQLSARFPENFYLKCSIANSLCEIYHAQINHRFSEVVDFPDIHYAKSYNEFLSFLQNLNKIQLKNITVNYSRENIISLKKEDSYSRYIDFLVKGIDKSRTEYTSLVAEYQKDNTLDAHYKALLDEKFKVNLTKKN